VDTMPPPAATAGQSPHHRWLTPANQGAKITEPPATPGWRQASTTLASEAHGRAAPQKARSPVGSAPTRALEVKHTPHPDQEGKMRNVTRKRRHATA
jgi:hypothetical protein